MATEIRICQFMDLLASTGIRHLYQNYFVQTEPYILQGVRYAFMPFQASGALASLNGENNQLSILFPNQEVVVRFVEAGDGNRLSELALTTAWLNPNGSIATKFTEFYIGTGAAFDDTTVELRFRSSMDSVGARFPGRTLTVDNVGVLPLNADLYLR
jgi:phage-related protein